jgi:hypothetical protein
MSLHADGDRRQEPRQSLGSESTTTATPGCSHFLADFFRIPIAGGRCQVRELCVDCGANVRGGGINVPFAEAVRRTGHGVEQLPVWAGPRQRKIGGGL